MTENDRLAPDGLMLFDGVCHLCDGTVRTLLAWDRTGALRFTPIQSPYGQRLARAHGLDPEAPESFLFFNRGRALGRAAGFAALLRRLPAPWRWLSAIDRLPRPLADGAYDAIAGNRYRLFGRRDRCMVPTPAQRDRFLLD